MTTTGDNIKPTNGNAKWIQDYLSFSDKDAKALCKKLNILSDDSTVDIVKNIMWAAEKFEENSPKIKNKQINVYIHWSVDPDALSSAKCLSELFLLNGANDVRILGGKFAHPQNVEMVEICHIVIFNANEGFFEKGINCMVDTVPPLGERNTSQIVNHMCKEFFLVMDHHNTYDEISEHCKECGIKPVTIPVIGKRVGSTATMMALLSLCMKQMDKITPETQAALLFGIYSDTNGLLQNVTPLDSAMFNILNAGRASELFSQVQYYEYPEDWLMLKHRAYKNQVSVGRVKLTTTGLTNEHCRDVIAECASDIIRQKNTLMSFCLAITVNGLELSVRANSRLLRMEPNRIIQIVQDLFAQLFPGKSGFKFSEQFPNHIQGGSCVSLESIDQIWLDIKEGKPDYNSDITNERCLVRCKEYMESIIKVMKRMSSANPELMAGFGISE
jgi:nanoRNase/pAp phosphatase (c-di-AMP/oligoRNAs hydrolase)